MDVVALIGRMQVGYLSRSRVPSDLESVTHRGDEADPSEVGATREAIEAIEANWRRAEALYRTGKPVIRLHVLRLVQLVSEIHDCFPPIAGRRAA